MPTFTMPVAMDVRAYGFIEIEADTLEDAKSQITAELVADKFNPHGSADDFDFTTPRDIWIEDATNEDTGEIDQLDFSVPNGSWVTV